MICLTRLRRLSPIHGQTGLDKIKLPYVQAYRDCRGKVRHYVRRRGKPNVSLPGLPGSSEFMEAYQSAIAKDLHAPRLHGTMRAQSAI